MKKVLIRIIIVVIIILLVGGYLGFIPGFSNLFGSNRPRNLGVNYTTKDLESAKRKTGVSFIALEPNLPPKDSIKFSGKRSINTQLTSEELTSLVREIKWKYLPLKEISMKINNDGYLETSSVIDGNRVTSALKAYNIIPGISFMIPSIYEYVYALDDKEKINKFYSTIDMISKFLKANPSFYTKAKANVYNNKLTDFKIDAVYLGRLNITGIAKASEGNIKNLIEDMLNNTPGLFIRSLAFKDMKVHMEGTIPERISYSP